MLCKPIFMTYSLIYMRYGHVKTLQNAIVVRRVYTVIRVVFGSIKNQGLFINH